MTNKTSRRAIRCAQYVLDHFRFENVLLPKNHEHRFITVYSKPDAPVANHPASRMYMNLVRDSDLISIYLPIGAPRATWEQEKLWKQENRAGREVMSLNTKTKRFAMSDTSALLRLARQYNVPEPADLTAIPMRTMVKFFNTVQAAVYAPVGMDLYFPNQTGAGEERWKQESDYEYFFMVSLFAQSYGTTITFESYKILFAEHIEYMSLGMAEDPSMLSVIFDIPERANAITLIFNNLVTDDLTQVQALMNTPPSLLRDLYPVNENDDRFSLVF